MCELNSPPYEGESGHGIFWNPAQAAPPPKVGEEFTLPWGVYAVTYRVDEALPSRRDGVARRLTCTVMKVDLERKSR